MKRSRALLSTSLAAVLIAGLLTSAPLRAQPAAAPASGVPSTAVTANPADPADVASVDALMAAVYAVISGPAGQARDWNRMRSLFAPGARLVPTGRRTDGTALMRNWTVEDYISTAGPNLERDGFFERELGRKVQRYGNIVHVLSAYDSKRKATDEKPFARGVNSFQLWFDGTRWWVVTIFWEGETPANPLPSDLLAAPPRG
jgi:hypothetical protein